MTREFRAAKSCGMMRQLLRMPASAPVGERFVIAGLGIQSACSSNDRSARPSP